jgi:uncharacterized protein with NAD-binding domain and iron-sulfur cluster
MSDADIAVIGGGLAGMSAALAAADGGARVILLEQRPHLGGAASSFMRDGLWYDYGQHIFLRCCSAYRSFIQRIAGNPHLLLQKRLEIPVAVPGKRRSWIRRDSLPAPLHLARSVLGYHPLTLGERSAILPAAMALKRVDVSTSGADTARFYDWLLAHHQSASAIAHFWDLIALPTLNLPAGEASLLAAARMFRMGLLDDAAAADIGWADVPLSSLHDELAAEALRAAGPSVRLRSKVCSINIQRAASSRGGVTVELADGERIAASAAILAVPHTHVAGILPHGRFADLHRLGTSAILDVHLRFASRVLPFAFAVTLGDPMLWAFDRTKASATGPGTAGPAGARGAAVSCPGTPGVAGGSDGSLAAASVSDEGPGGGRPAARTGAHAHAGSPGPIRAHSSDGNGSGQYLVLSISGADRLLAAADTALIAMAKAKLGEAFAEMAGAELLGAMVIRSPAATYRAGISAESFRLPVDCGLAPVFLAGAWTATGWPATMESAVRSGIAAARAALGLPGKDGKGDDLVFH